MTDVELDQLGDDELLARLVNRGVPRPSAVMYVSERDNVHTAEAILRILEGPS